MKCYIPNGSIKHILTYPLTFDTFTNINEKNNTHAKIIKSLNCKSYVFKILKKFYNNKLIVGEFGILDNRQKYITLSQKGKYLQILMIELNQLLKGIDKK